MESENRSKKGRKPWAEVLVVRCISCGATKRFPVGSRRRRAGSGSGDQLSGDIEGEYTLWCDREEVVEGN